jgi:hypothetical protein
MAANPVGLTGHTMRVNPTLLYERRPETVVPGDSLTWTQLPPRLFQEWYPFVFPMPNGNAFVAGPSIYSNDDNYEYSSYQIDVSSGVWTRWPENSGSGFKGGSAAMFAPGRILKCGSRETEYNNAAVKTTKVIDLNAASPQWQSSPNLRHARVFHNLTLLPTGDILATGGLGQVKAAENTAPVFEPELWHPPDPQYPAYPQGAWYYGPGGSLAPSPRVRGYHSVALLLPDARVLVSGGNEHPDAYDVSLYCPPYLFGTDGTPAARPVIGDAPPELRWGQTFTVCVADTANIRGACLIRPGAVTHGFDENQRFVPLQIAGHAGGPQRLFLTAPANAFEAPPGYYLLFLTGSVDGSDVPSIAKWVRLDGPGGPDLCDVVPPGTPALTPDIIGPTEVWLAWTAPGDDAELPVSGSAVSYDLRQALAPIASEAAWSAATPATGPDPLPLPWPHPTGQSFGVTGLAECTTYSFALRATDDHAGISALPSPAFTVSTTCGGAGGGTSARGSRDEEGARAYAGSAPAGARERRAGAAIPAGREAQAASAELQGTVRALVAETRRMADRTWQVTLRLATHADGLDLTGADVTVDHEAGEGTHDSLARYRPGAAENLLGLCALRERGRVAVRSFLSLDRVVPRFQRLGRDLELVAARHSRLGDLRAAFVAEGSRPELSDGDAIELTYAEAGEASPSTPHWYLLLFREGSAPPIPFAPRRSPGEAPPGRFALHPSEPNPTSGVTGIRFDLAAESPVALEVFDLLGRRVATLADRTLPAGSHRAEWDLRDAGGAAVRPGVYVVRLAAGTFRARGKVSVVP